MPLLNNFLLGADPEFVVIEEGYPKQFIEPQERDVPWGLDHSNWVIEPHPKPEYSVRKLIKNLKTSLNDFATVTPSGKWVAGAWLEFPERNISLGGHVHVDQPFCPDVRREAFDLFTQHLEKLDILPSAACNERRRRGPYGRYGDIRTERGHFEYRTMPSWLFSQRVTKLCLLGIKLISVDPEAPKATLGSTAESSIQKLQAFFERFRHKDDDVDWLLQSGIFRKKLNVKPDRDLRHVWKVEPVKEIPHWKSGVSRTEPAIVTNYSAFLPCCFEIRGHAMRFLGPLGGTPTDRDRYILESAFDMRNPAVPLRVGDQGVNIESVGRIGSFWDPAVPSKQVSIPVNGVSYNFRVLQNQIINGTVRHLLRTFILAGSGRVFGAIVLQDGLMFQPLGPID